MSDSESDATADAAVSGVTLFSQLSKAEVRDIMKAGRRVTLPQGWPLVSQSTPGDAAYIIIEGQAAVLLGHEKIAELGPGDIVGEIALRAERLRTATVSAQTALDVLRIDSEHFETLTRTISAFREAVDANVAARLKH